MFAAFTLNTVGFRQANKTKRNLTKHSWDVHQIQIKQHLYTVYAKLASKKPSN